MNSLISVIIPTYNSGRVIDICLNSLISQTYSNIEIIIVDDKSTDLFSIEHIKEWQKKDSRIKLYEKPINGRKGGESRLIGVSIAQGDYICFSDQDDWLPKDAIENMYSELVKNEADVVIGHIAKSVKVGPFIKSFRPGSLLPHTGIVLNHEDLMGSYYESYFGHNIIPVNVWGKLYKKTLFERAEFPDPLPGGIPGDLLLSLILHPYIERLIIIPDVVYNYFIGMPGVSPKYLNNWLPFACEQFDYKWSVIDQNNITQAVKYQAIEMINYIRSYVHLCTVYDYKNRDKRIDALGQALSHPIWKRVSAVEEDNPEYSKYVNLIINEDYKSLFEELEKQDLNAPIIEKIKYVFLRLCAKYKMFS